MFNEYAISARKALPFVRRAECGFREAAALFGRRMPVAQAFHLEEPNGHCPPRRCSATSSRFAGREYNSTLSTWSTGTCLQNLDQLFWVLPHPAERHLVLPALQALARNRSRSRRCSGSSNHHSPLPPPAAVAGNSLFVLSCYCWSARRLHPFGHFFC